VPETVGTIGNASRNYFHGPGINNYNLSFYTNTIITERLNLQLRLDAFNIFNHTQFAGPAQAGTAAAGDNAINVNAGDFGQILATQEDARVLQLSAHFTF
jgi:hypothetical protein